MSWLKKFKKEWEGQSTDSSAYSSNMVEKTPTNAQCDTFKSHWEQILQVIHATSPQTAFVHTRETTIPKINSVTADDIDAVRNLLEQMIFLLVEEQTSGELLGPILEFAITQCIFQQLFDWWVDTPSFHSEILLNLLKVYEVLISQAQHSLLHHKQLVIPMLNLLSTNSCARSEELDGHIVLLLNLLCVWMNRDPTLLEVFFNASTSHGPANFLIFSLLIDFIHREGTVGQQARDALLLCMALSSENEMVANYIVKHSNFCPVLATGLSALYSTLPRHMVVRTDDWHCLHRSDWSQVPSLINFMNSFEFCNSVIEVAHVVVGQQLLNFFYNGFLVSVFGPSLHKKSEQETKKTSADEVVVTTAYLNLFLRSVTAPSLMCCFLRFLLTHRHESSLIINTLIQRIASNNRLALVSLSLMRTLVDLNCEDLMLQLVFRYLIPCQHLLISQRRAICDIDLHNASAARFLALTPIACHSENLGKPETDVAMFQPVQSDEPSNKIAKAAIIPPAESSNGVSPNTTSTMGKDQFHSIASPATLHDTGFSFSSPKLLKANDNYAFSEYTVNEDLSVTINMHSAVNSEKPEDVAIHLQTITSPSTMAEFGPDLRSQLELNTSYMDYLEDARVSITQCSQACSQWSAPYDGENPSPQITNKTESSLGSTSELRPKCKSNDEHNNFRQGDPISNSSHSAMKALSATFQTLNLTALAFSGHPPKPIKPKETQQNDVGLCHTTPLLNTQLDENVEDKKTTEAFYEQNINNYSDIRPKTEIGLMEKEQELECDEILLDTTKIIKPYSNSVSQSSSVDDFFRSLMDIVPKLAQGKMDDEKHHNGNTLQNDEDIESGIEVSSDGELHNHSLERNLIDEVECEVSSNQNDDTMSQVSVNTDDMTDDPVKLMHPVCEISGTIENTSIDFSHNYSNFTDNTDDELDDSSSITSSSFYEPCSDYVPTEMSIIPAPPLKLQGLPYTGPLIGTLFAKLDQMINNSLYENLLLTGIMTRLACYPHPLLRSFLLNTQMVFHPSVRSLYQVLNSARNKIDSFAAQVSDFDVLVKRAQKYLLARGTIPLSSDARSRNTVQQKPMPVPKIKNRTFGDMFMRRKPKDTKKKSILPRLETLLEGRNRSKINESAASESQDGATQSSASQFYVKQSNRQREREERKLRELRTKNAVYASIVLAEFLKELAAVAQEHAVVCAC